MVVGSRNWDLLLCQELRSWYSGQLRWTKLKDLRRRKPWSMPQLHNPLIKQKLTQRRKNAERILSHPVLLSATLWLCVRSTAQDLYRIRRAKESTACVCWKRGWQPSTCWHDRVVVRGHKVHSARRLGCLSGIRRRRIAQVDMGYKNYRLADTWANYAATTSAAALIPSP